jgi:hypothetical protein
MTLRPAAGPAARVAGVFLRKKNARNNFHHRESPRT